MGNYVGSHDQSESKLLPNSSFVRIVVVKKTTQTSGPSIVLQSLCQNYECSDNKDWTLDTIHLLAEVAVFFYVAVFFILSPL